MAADQEAQLKKAEQKFKAFSETLAHAKNTLTKKKEQPQLEKQDCAPNPMTDAHDSIIKVLVVDDEKPLTDLVRRILERMGGLVTVASGGAEALEIFQVASPPFDLVITDQSMPHMTGIQLAQNLKSIKPDIPIILSTGLSKFFTPDTKKDLGFEAVLMKPFEIGELTETVRQVLALPPPQ